MIVQTRLSLSFVILASCSFSFLGISTYAFSTTKTISATTPQDVYSTIGAAIPTVNSLSTGLELASRFWLPTDLNLPNHLAQPIHHEKRQRWASQLLTQLAKVPPPPFTHVTGASTPTSTPTTMLPSVSHFGRLIQAAATPTPSTSSSSQSTIMSIVSAPDRLGKEATWIMESLQAIYTLAGRYHPHLLPIDNDDDCLQGIQTLVHRALALGTDYPLDHACRVYWAIQGLQARLKTPLFLEKEVEGYKISKKNIGLLQQRVQALPFEIIPMGVEYGSLLGIDQNIPSGSHQIVCQRLLQEIPFSRDTIVTRQGTSVAERRGTAWVAAPGVGALAYSGKLMVPQPIPTILESVMRRVEQRLGLADGFFDCALCNHYADAIAACKFHTDPEHGTMWDRTTVVVAAGSDRVFAFKPISTTWNDWDHAKQEHSSSSSSTDGGSTATTTPLFAGDLVVMRGNCNDDFYHAVHAGISDDPRVSLVLKRAIGPRGHGLPGQGRRFKNRNNSMVDPALGSPPRKTPGKPTYKSKRKRSQ